MLIMHREEVCYGILNYDLKLLQKLPFFHEFHFLKKHIYVNKATLQIFDIF